MSRILLWSVLAVSAGVAWRADAGVPSVSAILTSRGARLHYLAHARIWSEPERLSPEEVLNGPSDARDTVADAAGAVECTFAKPGKELGGNTPKFLCRTDAGRTLRLKYWDPDGAHSNREVFTTVAATRLLWALGFDALPTHPVTVRCRECPDNPMTGKGARGTRAYVAEWQAYPASGPWVLSREDHDQGWSWEELDRAIASLPPGPERTRQRTHFDALTLLGVFMQHGDRKPEQQALYCAGSVDGEAGEMRAWRNGGTGSILVERPAASSCAQAAVMIADTGATFGGAGRTSNPAISKMNLEQWRHHHVFKEHDRHGACRGRLVVSLAAGRQGERNPVISEEGRRFLLDQLQRLTAEHVRALFTAARVDMIDPSTTPVIDEWVDAFQDKVRQIASEHCRPA